MSIQEFCVRVHKLHLSQVQQSLAILWFFDQKTQGVRMTPGEIAKVIQTNGLGSPHSTRLGEAIRKTGLVLSNKSGFQLTTIAREKVRVWVRRWK